MMKCLIKIRPFGFKATECALFINSIQLQCISLTVWNKIHAFDISVDITGWHGPPPGRMPLNFLERPVTFRNTDEGFRHNKSEGGEGV